MKTVIYARVINSVSDEPIENGMVEIEDDHIVYVGEKSESTEDSQKPDPLSPEEERLCAISDDYTGDPEAQESRIKQKFADAVKKVADAVENKDGDIRIDNFEAIVVSLDHKAKDITKDGKDICKLMKEIQDILDNKSVSEDLKSGLQDDLDKMKELFGENKLQVYASIAEYLKEKDLPVNKEYSQTIETAMLEVSNVINAYLKPEEYEWNPAETLLEQAKWNDFKNVASQKELYDELVKTFKTNGEKEDQYEKQKQAANTAKDNAENSLTNETTVTSARDIPQDFGYGRNTAVAPFKLTDMIGAAADMFSINKFKSNANMLLLKLYTVQYDFGMFSSRVTNVNKDQEKEVSLTGYEMNRQINYLYQAELEYLLGGNNSSKSNLEEARNKILAIRAVTDYTATYAIHEVNSSIKAVQNAATAVNPILGVAVGAALRIAVTVLETAQDWSYLKDGKGVVLIKRHLEDMTAYSSIAALLGNTAENKAEDKCVRLDYEQYLKLMIIFMTTTDQVMNRTRNLIELNVNAAEAGLKEDQNLPSLTFHMKDAHTAVNATCTVHLDFLVMPEGFAQKVATSDDYNSLMEFEKNSYKFTVTRGY